MVRTEGGRNLDLALVEITSSFEGKRLGILNPRTGLFRATEPGTGTLHIRATLRGAPTVRADAAVQVHVLPADVPDPPNTGSTGKR